VGYALPDDPRLSVFATPRLNGVRAACQRLGLAPPREQQVPLDPRGAAAAVAGFLPADDPITAICADNDEIALAVLAGLRAQDLTAATDVAVIGVDNIPAAVPAAPPLTTVDFNPAAIGRHLATIVLGETENAPDTLPAPTVVVRESA
jgi:DNA-binding LacI/PurR family transcriptional regulator